MSQPFPPQAKPRVLVIDGDYNVQYFIRLLLQDICFTVAAYTADAAYALLESRVFDLVILSIEQPKGPDTLDVLRAVRATPGYETIPVLGLTLDTVAEQHAYWQDQGFNDVVSKLPDPLVLCAAVRGILEAGASSS